jgi:predicted nucleic acid-binding protein
LITQGALARTVIRLGDDWSIVDGLLKALEEIPGYEFWPDSIGYRAIDGSKIIGHKQVTDAYLVTLAKARNAKLATFDIALAAANPDDVLLISS